MQKIILIVAFSILITLGTSTSFSGSHSLFQSDSLKVLQPRQEHTKEAFIITNLLKRYHYRKLTLSDSISNVIFNNYFLSIDPSKAYFFNSDISHFEDFRDELDDQIPSGDLDFAYDVFELYRERALDRIDYVFKLLETEFDFTKDESYEFDRDGKEWPSTEQEQDELWRKMIKNQALTYKISDNDWDEIAETLTKRYQRIQKAIYQYNSEDVFQLYMNAFTDAYDPHTDYFSPPDAANFQIEMGLSLEGIGARLTQNLDYTQVTDIIPGGPAYKSKGIFKDDRIIGVAQGDHGEFIDVIGWRIDDVVEKIRGSKGTVIRLQILKASEGVNAMPDTLRLVRDKIKLESQAAKSELIPISAGNNTYNLGIITIPSFYLNFKDLNSGAKDYKSTTRDVKKLISELNEQGMDGLMIDLRYNGGGSLQEAIELTGLFIPGGPVVQIKNTDQSVDRMEDQDGGDIFYGGPLAILVNRGSASASEIFSGAIQDYRRGIVLGENTFGKGTVQNIINLDRYINMDNYSNAPEIKLGQLKLTLAKFYRITGSSNQLIGITPDVQFPSEYDTEHFGEASRPNALPWDEITKANFQQTNNIDENLLNKLNELYTQHSDIDSDLKQLITDVEHIKKLRNKSTISLNLEERKNENQRNDESRKLLTSADQDEVTTSEVEEKLKKDPYLKEGLNLLAEITKRKIG